MADQLFFEDPQERREENNTGSLVRDRYKEVKGEATVKEVGVQFFNILRQHLEKFLMRIPNKDGTRSILINNFKVEDSLYSLVRSILDFLHNRSQVENHLVGGVEKDRVRATRKRRRNDIRKNPLYELGNCVEDILVDVFDTVINSEKERDVDVRRRNLVSSIRDFVDTFALTFRGPNHAHGTIVIGWIENHEANEERTMDAYDQLEWDISERGLEGNQLLGSIDRFTDRVVCDWKNRVIEREQGFTTRFGAEFPMISPLQTSKLRVEAAFMEVLAGEEDMNVKMHENPDMPGRTVTNMEEVEEFVKEAEKMQKMKLKDVSEETLRNLTNMFVRNFNPEQLEKLHQPNGTPRKQFLNDTEEVVIPKEKAKLLPRIEPLKVPVDIIGDLNSVTAKYGEPKLTSEEAANLYKTQEGFSPVFTSNRYTVRDDLEKRRENCLEIEDYGLGLQTLKIIFVQQNLTGPPDEKQWSELLKAKLQDKPRASITSQELEICSNFSFLMAKENVKNLSNIIVDENICVHELTKDHCVSKLCQENHVTGQKLGTPSDVVRTSDAPEGGAPGKKCGTSVTFPLLKNTNIWEIEKTFDPAFVTPSGAVPEIVNRKREGKDARVEVYIPFVSINKHNVRTILEYIKLQSSWDRPTRAEAPFCYSEEDEKHYQYRFPSIEWALRHSVPMWFATLAAVAEHYTLGIGCGDTKTYVPRNQCLSLCTNCGQYFEDTTSLLLHNIFEEDALDVYQEKDHLKCNNKLTKCWCRLSKKHQEREGFDFVRDRPVLLVTIAHIDLSTMTVDHAKDNIITLAQLGIPCYLPYSIHGEPGRGLKGMVFPKIRARAVPWSEHVLPNLIYINAQGEQKVKRNIYIQKFSSVRMSPDGHIIFLTTQGLISDLLERSSNRINTFDKVPNVHCASLSRKDPTVRGRSNAGKSILATELGHKPALVFGREEIIWENILRYSHNQHETEEEQWRGIHTARHMMEIGLSMATNRHGVHYEFLRHNMWDFSPAGSNWNLTPAENDVGAVHSAHEIFSSQLFGFSDETLSSTVINFGMDPVTGIPWNRGSFVFEETRMLQDVVSPAEPFGKMLEEIEALSLELGVEWPRAPPRPDRKTKSRKRIPTDAIKKSLMELAQENAKKHLKERAEKAKMEIEKQKKDIKVRLNRKKSVYMCDMCLNIKLSPKGKRPSSHVQEGCFFAYSKKEQSKIYKRWKEQEELKIQEIIREEELKNAQEVAQIEENFKELEYIESSDEEGNEEVVTMEDVVEDTDSINPEGGIVIRGVEPEGIEPEYNLLETRNKPINTVDVGYATEDINNNLQFRGSIDDKNEYEDGVLPPVGESVI